jgi:hypothetical protein
VEKEAYLSCKSSVLQKLDTDKKTSEQNKKTQQQFMLQKSKQQTNQTYLIIGIIAVILGVVIYKKMNK